MTEFKVGDRVQIRTGLAVPEFAGLSCVVVGLTDLDNPEEIWGRTPLKPESDRPDGYGLNPFSWPPDDLLLLEPLPDLHDLEAVAAWLDT